MFDTLFVPSAWQLLKHMCKSSSDWCCLTSWRVTAYCGSYKGSRQHNSVTLLIDWSKGMQEVWQRDAASCSLSQAWDIPFRGNSCCVIWQHFGELNTHFAILTNACPSVKLLRQNSGHKHWVGYWQVQAIKPYEGVPLMKVCSASHISWRDAPENKALEDAILCVECALTGRGEGRPHAS